MTGDSRKTALTISEAAELLGVSAATLRNWDRAGKLKTSRHPISGYRLYPLNQVIELQRVLSPSSESATSAETNTTADRGPGIDAEGAFPGSPRRPAQDPENLGQHMTPLGVARQMFDFLHRPVASLRILDPACGDGNLLIAAADRMLHAGLQDIADRLAGIDIDPEMVAIARQRLAEKLSVDASRIRIFHADFLESAGGSLFVSPPLSLADYNAVLSNPPYGRSREYAFFTACARCLPAGSEMVFLMPLSFIDRAEGLFTVPLEGRPLGVTTGHAIIRHVCGQPYHFRPVKEHQCNKSPFSVLSGLKLYELGAGMPPQTDEIVSAKPYSSSEPRDGWIPCLRTGDIHPFSYTTGRLYVHYGAHLAHPKNLSRFQGPRLFLRRVPIWQDRQLGAAYLEDTVLCAGDLLVIRHYSDDREMLRGLCSFLNSPAAAEAALAHRPSVRFRDSFPKLSAKDLNALLDSHLPDETALRLLAAEDVGTGRIKKAFPAPHGSLLRPETSRFIELDFPVEGISDASSREKSIRQGHISTLQLWWARRPLAVCRAAILASLIPHPSVLPDSNEWLKCADEILPGEGPLIDRLSAFLSHLAKWESCCDEGTLDQARKLIRAAHSTPPVVLDTFAGGGSFPIEALRLGAEAIASDLNPVAVAALRVALEHVPGSGEQLSAMLERACATINERLSATAERLYGNSPEENVLAVFWCRTFTCPKCGSEVPLLRDRVLSDGTRRAVVVLKYNDKQHRFEFMVQCDPSADAWKEAASGTVCSTGATCPSCQLFTSTKLLQAIGNKGAIGERVYAVRIRTADGLIRYRSGSEDDNLRASKATLRRIKNRETKTVPDEPLDPNGVRHTWAMQYGVRSTADLYNQRQGVALLEVLHEMRIVGDQMTETHRLPKPVEKALRSLLAFTLNRLAMYSSRHSWWQSTGEFPANMFGRQAIPFVWNYVEMPFCSESAGGLSSACKWVSKASDHCGRLPLKGRAYQADAAKTGLVDSSVDLVAIDPPYYDSIAYSYLADVFYVWMREALRGVEPELFAGSLCPKTEEAIVDRPHSQAPALKDDAHFRRKMVEAFGEIRRVLRPNGRAIVMFGHKSLDAWDAVMTPLLSAGLTPVASWPVHTERKTKFRHGRIAALSSSCLMVCRPQQSVKEPSIEWPAFLAANMVDLQAMAAHYRECRLYGVDLLTAMVAPALARFARYESVTEKGHGLTPADLLSRLPEVMLAFRINAVLQHTSLHGDNCDWLKRLQDDPAKVLGFDGTSPLIRTVKQFADMLDRGETKGADRVWLSLSQDTREAAQNLLEGVGLLADDGSRLGQLAHACLGRVSLLQRR